MGYCYKRIRKIVQKIESTIRSKYYSSKIDIGDGFFEFRSCLFPLIIKKSKSAQLIVNGIIGCESFLSGKEKTLIELAENSKLIIEGDFDIGTGVKIYCGPNATIRIKGKQAEKACGISSNTIIMSKGNISIGYDFICSWNVFISDSDMHYIEGAKDQSDVFIGDHVWIAQGASVLKGSEIGSDCIVACGSVVTSGKYKEKSLLVGSPAYVKKENISWQREFPN